jgi:hypothetical protein
MVQALLADVNIQGHADRLLWILEGPEWRGVWTMIGLQLRTFRDFDLAPETVDAEVWQFCQERQLLLITANRNAEGPDSLEVTIRTKNTADSLPVFTLADAEQVMQSPAYAERVVERLLEYLIDIDNYRGAGRLYLP